MNNASDTQSSFSQNTAESNMLEVMLEEYTGLQEEIRLTDNLYMQSFAYGFTGIAAIIGVFIASNNFIMQFFGASFMVPLTCTILSYFLFLHQEHVRYTVFILYISQYRIDSLLKKTGTVFARTLVKTSRIIKPINSRDFLSISPMIIMHTYQTFSIMLHLYLLITYRIGAQLPYRIQGLSESQYLLICYSELFFPFVFLIIWHYLTKKMRTNIKSIKNARRVYFSNLSNIRARIL